MSPGGIGMHIENVNVDQRPSSLLSFDENPETARRDSGSIGRSSFIDMTTRFLRERRHRSAVELPSRRDTPLGGDPTFTMWRRIDGGWHQPNSAVLPC